MVSLHPIVKRILSLRGVAEADFDAFCAPAAQPLVDAETLPHVVEAVRVILPLVRDKRKIVVFGDYDCDGVCAAAILATTLERLGGKVAVILPHRLNEGYGLTQPALDRLFHEHPDVALLVTVDNGVTAVDEIAAVRARGVKVVVTDHHLANDRIPEADAMVETKLHFDDATQCQDLCGAGVAFFLSYALVAAAKREGLYDGPGIAGPLLVLAGLATVADLMPLKGQNRVLVARALACFERHAPPGLRELCLRVQRRVSVLTSRDFGFVLAPRINAAGRMDSALLAYDLLRETDPDQAREKAMRVDGFNAERKTTERKMAEDAAVRAADAAEIGAVVASRADWHLGVAGIVAARLAEEKRVPAAIAVGNHGSARAPAGYSVHDALSAAAEALDRFGGHDAAGGFSVKPGRFEDFKRLFAAACRKQRAERAAEIERGLFPDPDCWVEPGDLSFELLADVRKLEPFGEGNREPILGLRAIHFSDARTVGVDGKHGVFYFTDRRLPCAVWWNHGGDVEQVRRHAAHSFDVLFVLSDSDYGMDGTHLELRLVAIRPAGAGLREETP